MYTGRKYHYKVHGVSMNYHNPINYRTCTRYLYIHVRYDSGIVLRMCDACLLDYARLIDCILDCKLPFQLK